MLPVILERVEHINDHIWTFSFRPEKKVSYVAGMFTELYLNHEPHDDRGQRRWFTLSSSPTEDLLTITTKFAPKSSSFKAQLHALELGTPLKLAEPMGDFILPKDEKLPLVFIAGGIGITPFHSMISWLSDKKLRRNITLIYSANTEEDLVFKELLDSYKMKTHYVVTKPSPTWSGLSGHLTSERILELTGPIDTAHIYLSGPEPMVESLADGLKATGIPPRQVIVDFFPGYSAQ